MQKWNNFHNKAIQSFPKKKNHAWKKPYNMKKIDISISVG
jgi:hypothetical protein